MQTKSKESKFFSKPLMKQNIKSNWILTLIICLVICMMTSVITFAMSIMGDMENSKDKTDAQADLYSHLFVMAAYNANYSQTTGVTLSADDFMATDDKSLYDNAFAEMSTQDTEFSSEKLAEDIEVLKDENGSIANYVDQFEYVYALQDEQGVFSGKDLDLNDALQSILGTMGISSERLEVMTNMDRTAMINKMYFTLMGLIPIFLFIVIVGNSLIVNQVDSGSLAYVLATPTKRSAVANTQMIFLIVSPMIICAIGCIARIVASSVMLGEVNVKMNIALYIGMYLLAEAIGGICYMGSCLFNQSSRSMAFGGGIAVWCFIASLLGMFGSQDMVNVEIGVEELDIFNKLTLVGLYDINALSTVGSGDVDFSFVWKLCVLAGVAIVTYAIGKFRFQKKDLPL